MTKRIDEVNGNPNIQLNVSSYLLGQEMQSIQPQGLGPRAGVNSPQQHSPSSITPASAHLIRHVAAPQQWEVLTALLCNGLLKQSLHGR